MPINKALCHLYCILVFVIFKRCFGSFNSIYLCKNSSIIIKYTRDKYENLEIIYRVYFFCLVYKKNMKILKNIWWTKTQNKSHNLLLNTRCGLFSNLNPNLPSVAYIYVYACHCVLESFSNRDLFLWAFLSGSKEKLGHEYNWMHYSKK